MTRLTGNRDGFSLLEILVVLTVMATLASLAVISVGGIGRGAGMNQAVSQVSGLLEQARQESIATHTYVWVAIYNPNSSSTDPLVVAVIASRDGSNTSDGTTPISWTNATIDLSSPANSNLMLMNKVYFFDGILFQGAAVFTATQIPALSSEPAADATVNNLSNGAPQFSINGGGRVYTCTRVIEFAPSGQACINTAPVEFAEFGLQSRRGNTVDPNNIAVFRVSGLTGLTRLYRK